MVRSVVQGVQIVALMAEVGTLQAENARLREALSTVRGHLTGTTRAASACLSSINKALAVDEDELTLSGPELPVLPNGVLHGQHGHCVDG